MSATAAIKLPKELEEAVREGESLLAERARIAAALSATEGEQASIYDGRRGAEAALREAEAEFALGRLKAGDLDATRKRFAEAQAAQSHLVARVFGLRERLAKQETGFGLVGVEIEGELPAFVEQAAREFEREWIDAARTWGAVLGKRAAIEAALGQSLSTLPEPQASESSLDTRELSRPLKTLRALEAAAAELVGARTHQLRSRKRDTVPVLDAIYRFTREIRLGGRTFQPGDEILGALLGAPALELVLQNGAALRSDLLSEVG